MELNQLEYFYETAKREHITQTAEALNITQPALSKAISRLEDDLGVRLFEREGKNIRLNEYGQIVFRYTEQVLYTLGDMRAELSQMSAGRAGAVRLGSSFPAGEPNWVLEQVRTYALERPDISFHVKQYASIQLLRALEDREIDLAISTIPLHQSDLCWKELFIERMGVILSANHPLAARKELSMVDLREERFFCNNSNSDVQELTYRFCELAGFHPYVHFECEFPSFIGEAVSLGYGISLISERGHRQSRSKTKMQDWEKNIVYRPLSDDYCKRVCGVAYLEGRRLPRTVKAFYDHILESFPGKQAK